MGTLQGLLHPVLALFAQHEFLAIFCLLALEEAGIPLPIPGDMLLVLAGAHRRAMPLYAGAVLLTSTAAVFVGSSILYWFMRARGRAFLERYGKYLHVSQRRLDQMEAWFRRRGPGAIVCGRLIPGLRMPTTVMAGLSNVPYSTYVPTNIIAALIWSAIYFWFGGIISHEWRVVTGLVAGMPDTVSDWLLVGGVVGVVLATGVVAVWRWRRSIRARAAPAASD